MNLNELFGIYYSRHALINTKRPKNSLWFFNKYIKDRFGDCQIDKLTRSEIQIWMDELGMNVGSEAGNRALNTLSAILGWSTRRGYLDRNPCAAIRRFRVEPRERYLLPAELIRFKDSLEQETSMMRDFFWVALLTGCRRGNVQAMRWAQIDTTLEMWTIPASEHKNGKTHHVALTPPVLAILERRKLAAPDSAWVFPGIGKTGHLVEPKRAWARVLLRAGLTDMHMHDLRHTFASYLAMKGYDIALIAQALGHKDLRSTQIYTHLNLTTVRQAMEGTHSAFM